MKKYLILILISMMAVPLFAQYTATDVRGRVELETSPNIWQIVSNGDNLTGACVIRTGLGASVVFEDPEGVAHVILSNRVGMIVDLIHDNQRIRLNVGNITRVDTAPSGRVTRAIPTASARASDAAGDLDIAEE